MPGNLHLLSPGPKPSLQFILSVSHRRIGWVSAKATPGQPDTLLQAGLEPGVNLPVVQPLKMIPFWIFQKILLNERCYSPQK